MVAQWFKLSYHVKIESNRDRLALCESSLNVLNCLRTLGI